MQPVMNEQGEQQYYPPRVNRTEQNKADTINVQVHLNKLECHGKVRSVIQLKLWNSCIK